MQPVTPKKKDSTPFLFPWLKGIHAWSSKEAQDKAEDIRDMWATYGEYADSWLQHKTHNPDLQIWDFTDKELAALVKWSLKRGQQSATVAWALDMALDGRTDIDFVVILGTKGFESALVLNQSKRGRA